MNSLERFDRLVAAARREPAPEPDVRAAVRARLVAARRARPAVAGYPLGLVGACAVAAVVLGLLGYHSWTALTGPWLPLLWPLDGGLML